MDCCQRLMFDVMVASNNDEDVPLEPRWTGVRRPAKYFILNQSTAV